MISSLVKHLFKESKSHFERPFIQLATNKSWCATKISIGTPVFSHLYKGSTARTNL